MKDELYWQLDRGQVLDWLDLRGDAIKLTHTEIEDINRILHPFSLTMGTGGKYDNPHKFESINVGSIISRSGYCWFLEKHRTTGELYGYYDDIELMINKFGDEWYLVKFVTEPASYNKKEYWYMCDEIDGLIKLLKKLMEKLIYTKDETH